MRPLLTNYNVCSNVRLYSGRLQFMLWCSKYGSYRRSSSRLKNTGFLYLEAALMEYFLEAVSSSIRKRILKSYLVCNFFLEFLSTVRNGCYVNVNSVCNRQTIHPFIWLYVSFFNLYIFLEI